MKPLIIGRIKVNGKTVKPSYNVKVGDVIEVKFGDKTSKFQILQIPQITCKNISELIKIL